MVKWYRYNYGPTHIKLIFTDPANPVFKPCEYYAKSFQVVHQGYDSCWVVVPKYITDRNGATISTLGKKGYVQIQDYNGNIPFVNSIGAPTQYAQTFTVIQ